MLVSVGKGEYSQTLVLYFSWNRALLLWLQDNTVFVCSHAFSFRMMLVSILWFLLFKWELHIFWSETRYRILLNLPLACRILGESIGFLIPYLNIKPTVMISALPKLLNKFSLMLLVRLWVTPELFSNFMGILFIYQSYS